MNAKRYFFISLIICTLSLTKSLCQDASVIDSLRQELNAPKSNKQRIDILNRLANTLYIDERDSASKYAKEALRLSNRMSYSRGQSFGLAALARIKALDGQTEDGLEDAYKALNIANSIGQNEVLRRPVDALGFIYYATGQLDSVIKYDSWALNIAREMNKKDDIFAAHTNLALDYIGKSYYELALKNFIAAAKVGKEIKLDNIKYFQLYINISECYEAIDDLDNAINYSLLANEIINKTDDFKRQVNGAIDLARKYSLIKKHNQALDLINPLLLKIEDDSFEFKYLAAEAYEIIGTITGITKSPEEAIPLYEKAVFYSTSDNKNLITARVMQKLADAYISIGNVEKSDSLLSIALLAASEAGFNSLAQKVHRSMAKSDSLKNDLRGYINHLLAYTQIKDGIYTLEKEKAIAQLKIVYETELKDEQINLLNKEKEVAKVRQTKLLYGQVGLTIGSILLIALSIVIYSRYISKKKSLKIINQKNEENKLLIREIHHRVKNNLQIIMSLIGSHAPQLKHSVDAMKIITESQNRIKSLALIHQDLYNNNDFISVDAQKYFKKLLNNIDSSLSESKFNIDIKAEIEHIELKMSLAVPLGLILNELVTNCYKYAFEESYEGNINIEFSKENDGRFHLRVEDNGKGLPDSFDPQQQDSFGFQLVQGLAHQLNGTVNVEQHNGTTVDIFITDLVSAA